MVVATDYWVKMKPNIYQVFSLKSEFVDHEGQGRILGTIPKTLEVRLEEIEKALSLSRPSEC